MDLLGTAKHLAAPWADLYNESTPVQTGVTFAHFLGLFVAGGFAVATDRLTLRALNGPADRLAVHLDELRAVHRPVLIGLALTAVSGVLMFAADLDTYAPSLVFWTKMLLVVLLLGNGLLLLGAERRLRAADPRGRPALRRASVASVVLWVAILFVGTLLPNLSTTSAAR